MLRVAIYGKGGIGKSTTVSNLAGALADRGYRVMQIGCDPKADSTYLTMGGVRIPTILDVMRENEDLRLEEVVHQSPRGILCAEAGGPLPGTGCAGRGVITAFDTLDELDAYGVHRPDVVLYDVLGDVVCGGFSLPMRGEYADVVYTVTSGEMMARYAASNIASAVKRYRSRGYARLGGLILNRRNVADERELVEALAREEDTRVVADIPRSADIHRCEQELRTVVDAAPESEAARAYRALADFVLADGGLGSGDSPDSRTAPAAQPCNATFDEAGTL